MQTPTQATSWSIAEALAVAYTAFAQRFGADLLHAAFDALTAHADDATLTVGGPRFSDPPPERDPDPAPIAVDEAERLRHLREQREIHRAPFRLQLGPQGRPVVHQRLDADA